MQLLIDLRMSSVKNGSGMKDPCSMKRENVGCSYVKWYGEYPLNFNDRKIVEESEVRNALNCLVENEMKCEKRLIDHWLNKNSLDGIRVNIPLKYNQSMNSYEICHRTIQRWNEQINNLTKKSQTK